MDPQNRSRATILPENGFIKSYSIADVMING